MSSPVYITTTEYEDIPSTSEYIGPDVTVYEETEPLSPSIYPVYTGSPTYVVETEDSGFCLAGLCAALFCCCYSD